MEQTNQSKLDKQFYRISYRKHKERLTDIKQVTSMNFHQPYITRPEDKKKIMSQKIKKDQIDHENLILQNKINKIKNKSKNIFQGLYSTEKVIDHQKQKEVKDRYKQNQEQDNRLQVKSDQDSDMKFILPSNHKKELVQFYQKKVKKEKYLQEILLLIESTISETKKHFTLHQRKQDQVDLIKINLEKQITKHFINNLNKIFIINLLCSAVLEISLLHKRIFIIAYVMGSEKDQIRLMLDQKKTKKILDKYSANFQEFCQRIVIQKKENGLNKIKLLPENQQNEENNISEDQNKNTKNKQLIQAEFIKRNYYDTMGKSSQKESISTKKQNNTSNPHLNDHLQQFFQRLSAPRGMASNNLHRSLQKDHQTHQEKPQNNKIQAKHIDQNNTLKKEHQKAKKVQTNNIEQKMSNSQKIKDQKKTDQNSKKQFIFEFQKQKGLIQKSQVINSKQQQKSQKTENNESKVKNQMLNKSSQIKQQNVQKKQQQKQQQQYYQKDQQIDLLHEKQQQQQQQKQQQQKKKQEKQKQLQDEINEYQENFEDNKSDNVSDDDNYDEDFEENPSITKNSKLKQSSIKNKSKNDSIKLQKSSLPQQIKNESIVKSNYYEDEFQQEQIKQSTSIKNQSMNKSKKQNPTKEVQDNIQQENYSQEFDN